MNSAAEPDRCVQIKRGPHGPLLSRVWISRVPRLWLSSETRILGSGDLRQTFSIGTSGRRLAPAQISNVAITYIQSQVTAFLLTFSWKLQSHELNCRAMCGPHRSFRKNDCLFSGNPLMSPADDR